MRSESSAACPRVLHLITRLDSGGAATNTIISADLCRRHGFDTTVAYGVTNDPTGEIRAGLGRLQIPGIHFPYMVRDMSPLRDLLTLAQVFRFIRRGRYALVHTHCSKAGAIGRVAAVCCRVPVVHTPHGHIFYGYFGSIPTGLFVQTERWLARGTKRLISLTDIETEESLQRRIGKPDQYITIPSGVPLVMFRDIPPAMGRAFRKQWNIPGDAVLFVSVGRLVPVKGFDALLRAFAGTSFNTPEPFLAIAGDGALKAELPALARELGIEQRVRFTGYLPDIRPALGAADCFVLMSRNEGMGRAFIEAMAAGLPAIGPAVGGVPAFLKHGKNGFLVDRDDEAALSRAMADMHASRDQRVSMGQMAAESVYPEYDQSTMVAHIADLYRDVLGDKERNR